MLLIALLLQSAPASAALPPMPEMLRAARPYQQCLRQTQQDAPDLSGDAVLDQCADQRAQAIAMVDPVLATKPGYASADRRAQALDAYFDGLAALTMRAFAQRPQS